MGLKLEINSRSAQTILFNPGTKYVIYSFEYHFINLNKDEEAEV